MTPHVPIPQTPGEPDHAAPAINSSLPLRTFVQGILIDVVVAVCLLVIEATASESVDWWLLLASLGRTLLQVVASSVMRRLVPPTGVPPTG